MSVLISGPNVVLRDPIPADVDRYLYWMTHGEWREYDAPWEGICVTLSEKRRQELARKFVERCAEQQPTPRTQAHIATHEGLPLGWVSRYGEERAPKNWFVGITICDDAYLNRGMGTEALALWIRYLFIQSDIHRIGLDTWSLNPRMIRVAHKLGLVYEGAQREVIEWQGKWLDWVHFGLLRREWETSQG